MSTKQFIYASEIELPTTVISLLNGTSQFCFENPYFKVPGLPTIDERQYLSIYVPKTQTKSNNGIRLNTINIYYRIPATGVYTKFYAIGYTEVQHLRDRTNKVPKQYYVMQPQIDESKPQENNYRNKLLVSPAKGAVCVEDDKLAQLDYKFSMVMDVLLIAKITGIDLAKYVTPDPKAPNGIAPDNRTFYQAFIADINKAVGVAKQKAGKKATPLVYDEKLADSFNETPTFGKENGVLYPVPDIHSLEPESALFSTLFTSFAKSVPSAIFPEWKQIISKKDHNGSFPSFKFIAFPGKEPGQEKKLFDSRLTFIIELSPSDKNYNPTYPLGLITRQQVSPTKIEKMNMKMLKTLWGGESADGAPNAKVKGAVQQGCMYIVPQPSFKYFLQGTPTIDWRVEKIAVKRVRAASMSDYDEGADFLLGGDEEGETTPTTSPEQVRDTEDGAVMVEVSNENEAAIEALA